MVFAAEAHRAFNVHITQTKIPKIEIKLDY